MQVEQLLNISLTSTSRSVAMLDVLLSCEAAVLSLHVGSSRLMSNVSSSSAPFDVTSASNHQSGIRPNCLLETCLALYSASSVSVRELHVDCAT
jgi:hypothetical protein